MLCSIVLGLGEASAQSTQYVYDANGRVVAVTAGNGTSVQYSYNTLGHTSQVSAPLPPGQLAIFAFTPAHGVAGTQVTLQGQGFNSNAASDTVRFNGTLASVLSASTTQLVTTVPSGATSGPISVTVGTQTATSAAPFVIDDTGLPPTITQVSPVVVAVGGTVTVTGTHLDPVVGDTVAQMGGQAIQSLATVSDAQLQYAVPNNAVTSYITVTTPYGSSISATPVGVLPASVSAANVVSSGVAVAGGTGVNLNIGASGQMGAVVFTAPQAGWVSLQASGITTSASTINYTVYAPGNSIVQQGTVSAASPSIHLPHLTEGASYLVLVESNGGSTQMTLGVEADATLAVATSLTITTTTSGQSERLMVPSTMASGLSLEFALSNITASGGSSNEVDVYTYDATGTQANITRCYASNLASCRDFISGMTTAGTWSLLFVPANGGVMSLNVTLHSPVTGPLLSASAPTATINLGTGQFEFVTFNGTAGEPLTLNMSNLHTTPAGQSAYVVVYSPATQAMTPNNFYTYFDANTTPTVNIPSLPASGTYTIGIDTPSGMPMSGFLEFVPNFPIPLSGNGTSQSFNAAVPAQNAYMNFTANAGDSFELALSNIKVTGGSNGEVDVNVNDANGTQVASGSCYQSNPASNCRVFLEGLAGGSYSVVAAQPNGGVMSFNTSLKPPLIGPLLTPGTPVTVTLGNGQYELLTFQANAGQTATITMTGVNTAPAGQSVYVAVYRPDVGAMTPYNYYNYFDANSTPSLTLPNLPVSGAYIIAVDSPFGLPLGGQLSVSVQ
ncbi:IPT/TIG domain-containing protein [Dyella flagellata]|uniref:IPT/TIG domain-containing protein n=1 Tax=Dyella flagellata TaxID=1867833 RepID=A0ABQ5XHZ0_9GAMM|nr:IPT/TIG domain-containing protein [Dyella flagellata]GLQ90972.1 hypothetical protein GCM10007898_45480 [Dyella flagellata]